MREVREVREVREKIRKWVKNKNSIKGIKIK